MLDPKLEDEMYAQSATDFTPWPKINRWSKAGRVVVTEKIDGTNACVVISKDGQNIAAQSRTRIITPEHDNYGFATWVAANRDELMKLGPGHHFGEWWGLGIQRGYGLTEKRFSLFNTGRWLTDPNRPACCHVVPLLGVVPLDGFDSTALIQGLKLKGSFAAPGFMKPEGLVFFMTAAGVHFKKLCENDDIPKTVVDGAPVASAP